MLLVVKLDGSPGLLLLVAVKNSEVLFLPLHVLFLTMDLLNNILDCRDKFTEEFTDPPNEIGVTQYVYDELEKWLSNRQHQHLGYYGIVINEMMVQVDNTLPIKNAIRLRWRQNETNYVEKMYHLTLPPYEKREVNKWRRIIL